VIESDAAADFGKIRQLPCKLRRNLQHARNLIGFCQIGNFRKIAFDNRFDVGTVPILAAAFTTPLDSLWITSRRYGNRLDGQEIRRSQATAKWESIAG
jgi:hypothetical protein